MISLAFQSMEGVPATVHVVESIAALSLLLAESELTNRTVGDLIFVDLSLDDGTGFEVLSKLKSSPVNYMVPAIVLSGSHREDDVRLAYAHGAASFVTKPMDITEWLRFSQAVKDFWFKTVRLPPCP